MDGNHLEIISGGMPELLLYRENTDTVVEIESSGPPLGAFTNINYKVLKTDISAGDIVLIMSDGFAEQFNEKNEMLGFEKLKTIFAGNAEISTAGLINQFIETGKKFRGNRPQEDDITFVMIKYK